MPSGTGGAGGAAGAGAAWGAGAGAAACVAVPDCFVAQPAASTAIAAVMARVEKEILKFTVDTPLLVCGVRVRTRAAFWPTMGNAVASFSRPPPNLPANAPPAVRSQEPS